MNPIRPPAPDAIRLRRRIRCERMAGFAALMALGYLGWTLGVVGRLVVLIILVTLPDDELRPRVVQVVQACTVIFLGAIGLAGWWALSRPIVRRLETESASFDRAWQYLSGLVRVVRGAAVRRVSADEEPLSRAGPRWIHVSVTGLTVVVTIVILAVVRPWFLTALAAALAPLVGIAGVRLMTPGSTDRTERAVLGSLGVLAMVLVVVLGREHMWAETEHRRADGLDAAVIATGIEGDTWKDAQRGLRLALLAHQSVPSRLSANSLRRAINVLPVAVGTLSANDPGESSTYGRRLDGVVASSTGALVAGSSGDAVHIWTKDASQPIGRFGCRGMGIDLQFSSDDSLLAADCGSDRAVRLWDVVARRMRLEVDLSGVTRLRISPNSSAVAAVQADRCVHVFMLTDSRRVTPRCADRRVVDVMFARDEDRLAIARGPDRVTLELVNVGASDLTGPTPTSSWNPGERSFAVVADSGDVTVYDWRTGLPSAKISDEGVMRAFVDVAGQRLVTVGWPRRQGVAGSSRTVKAWSLSDAREEAHADARGAEVRSVAVSRSADAVAWRTEDNLYRYWRVGEETTSAPIPGRGPLGLSGDGRILVTGPDILDRWLARVWSFPNDDRSGTLHSLGSLMAANIRLEADPARGAVLYPNHVAVLAPGLAAINTTIPAAGVVSVHVAPNSRYAATRSETGELALWSLAEQQPVRISRDLPTQKRGCPVLFAPDGSWLAVASCDGELRVVGTVSSDLRMSVRSERSRGFTELAASSDSRRLASNDEHAVTVFDVDAQRSILTIRLAQDHRGHARVAFRPGSRELVVASTEQPADLVSGLAAGFRNTHRVDVWDTDRGRKVTTFRPNANFEADRLVFADDGTRLAVTNVLNGPIEIWHISRPAMLATIETRARGGLGFAAGGRQLFTVSGHGTAQLWSAESGNEIDRLPVTDVIAGVVSGRYVVTVSASREAKRWSIEASDLTAAGCARLDRGVRDRSWTSRIQPTCPNRPRVPE